MNATTVTCPSCTLMQHVEALRPGMAANCARCGSQVAIAIRDSLGRTAAFSLAALFLYVPANLYPIMRMEWQGTFIESTVWDGCVRLFEDGELLVAIIVFLASLLVPLLKLLGLFFLVTTTHWNWTRARKARMHIHRGIGIIGPWAMLDVFLLAILVSLVKFGRIATVIPGPGLLAFASVVVLTILASSSFEPRRIWEDQQPDS